MSVGLRAVQWNRDKIVYDAILLACVGLYLVGFRLIAWRIEPPKTLPDAIDLWIRATGSCAPDAQIIRRSARSPGSPLLEAALQPPPFRRALLSRSHFGSCSTGTCAQRLPNLAAEPPNGRLPGSSASRSRRSGLPLAILFCSPPPATISGCPHPAGGSSCTWRSMRRTGSSSCMSRSAMQDDRRPGLAICRRARMGAALHVAGGASARTGRLAGRLAHGRALARSRRGPHRHGAGRRASGFRDGNEIGAVTNLCAHQTCSARAASSTAASPVRGTATSIAGHARAAAVHRKARHLPARRVRPDRGRSDAARARHPPSIVVG